MRTVLLTFLALFLGLAVLLAFTVGSTPELPRFAALLGLLALPFLLVIALAFGVRLYLRRAPFSDAAPSTDGEGMRRDKSAPSTGAAPGGPVGRRG